MRVANLILKRKLPIGGDQSNIETCSIVLDMAPLNT